MMIKITFPVGWLWLTTSSIYPTRLIESTFFINSHLQVHVTRLIWRLRKIYPTTTFYSLAPLIFFFFTNKWNHYICFWICEIWRMTHFLFLTFIKEHIWDLVRFVSYWLCLHIVGTLSDCFKIHYIFGNKDNL